jgi:hypothetical protein
MIGKQTKFVWGIFFAGLALRFFCLPQEAFFCDVPSNLRAVESGRMIIQFPGYAPFHVLVSWVSVVTGSDFMALVGLSLACIAAATVYCFLMAWNRAGFSGALLSVVVMSFSPLAIYFSCVGASYATDALAVSGMIYHGDRFIRKRGTLDYYVVLGWFIVGCLMRPLSLVLCGLAVVALLLMELTVRRAVLTMLLFFAGALSYVAISVPYYGSIGQFVAGGGEISAQLSGTVMVQMLTNAFRVCIYPLWGLHLFLAITAVILWKQRQYVDRALALYICLLGLPYFLVLLRYVPHAGYYCLLLPCLVSLPWVAGPMCWLPGRLMRVGLLLAILFCVQFILVRPIPVSGSVSLVGNVYMFQYTRTGIQNSMFETLSSLSVKSGVLRNQVPPLRYEDIMRQGRVK